MDLFEAIERRASYRGAFLDKEVSEADIRRIVEAGLRAPSGYNLQTTSFVIARDAALRAQLAALLPTPAMRTAPVILAAVSKPLRNEGAGAAPFCFAVQDYAAAVENVMLAIAALGYAGVWMDGQTRMDGNDERIAALLRVPAGMTVHSLIPFGVPEQQPRQAPKKPFGERAVYDHF